MRVRHILTAIAIVAFVGGLNLAAAAPASATPTWNGVAMTIDCSSQQNGLYSRASLSGSLGELLPNTRYVLELDTQTWGDAYDPTDLFVTSDSQGTLTFNSLPDAHYISGATYMITAFAPGSRPPSVNVTANTCANTSPAVAAPAVSVNCPTRFLGSDGSTLATTLHVRQSLEGQAVGEYQTTIQGGPAPFRTTLRSDGSGSLDTTGVFATDSRSVFAVGDSLTWSTEEASQASPIASGTIQISNECGPLVSAPKNRKLTHDYDVSGDGYADLLAVDTAGNLLYYPNNMNSNRGHLPFTTGSAIGSGWFGAWSNISYAVAGDVSGDGYADILAVNTSGALVYYPNNILSNYGHRPYISGTTIGSGWLTYNRITTGDVNGDGRADIVAVRADGSMWCYQNNAPNNPGHLPYTYGVQILPAQNELLIQSGLQLGDLNGDGYADLFDSDNGFIYPNLTPSGSSMPYSLKVAKRTVPYNQGYPIAIAVGDYEGRGIDGSMSTLWDNTGPLLYSKNLLVAGGSDLVPSLIGGGWNTFVYVLS